MTIEHEFKAQPCLKCGHELSAGQSVDSDKGPGPGDITVCVYCSHLMEFGKDMTLIEPTDEKLVECAGDPRLIRAMDVAQRVRAQMLMERKP